MINISNELDIIIHNFQELKKLSPKLEKIGKMWVTCLENGHKILLCGNGGSASDAQHLAAELVGRYKMDRTGLAGLCLNTDTSALTAIGNDYGFEEIFARQIQGLGKKGDILVGLSTSGNSQNIVKAFEEAKKLEMSCIAFTGQGGGKLFELADVCLNVPSRITNNIQEMHIACGHLLCDYTEKYFFTKPRALPNLFL